MALRNEQIPLYAKFLGTGTSYEPGRLITTDCLRGMNIGGAAGEVPAAPFDYHRLFYGLDGIASSQHETFHADPTRISTVAKFLADDSVVCRFMVPGDGFARATLDGTFTGAAGDGETVTIVGLIESGLGRTYTYKTTLTGAADEIQRGLSAGTSRSNLIRAIMGAGVEGTDYGVGTLPHEDVTAGIGPGSNVIRLYSRHIGKQGNTMTATEAVTLFSWGTSGLFTGGGQPDLAAGEYFFTMTGQRCSIVSPFFGYLLQNGTWTVVGISSKLPGTHANSGIVLTLDAADVNGGTAFGLSYTSQGLGMHSKMDNDLDIVVAGTGNATGKTLGGRVTAAASFPAGGYVDVILRRRAV